MTDIFEVINEVFNALFYGSGSWFGLLLLLAICLGLLVKWKYSGALLLPITVFLGIEYLDKTLIWHTIIMWITAIFILLYMVKTVRG
jgi:hypothetical protein